MQKKINLFKGTNVTWKSLRKRKKKNAGERKSREKVFKKWKINKKQENEKQKLNILIWGNY